MFILTETLLNNKQKQKGSPGAWGYSHWAATHNVGNRGSRRRDCHKETPGRPGTPHPRTDKDDMGRVLHITLNLPTTPLGITGSTPRQETQLQNKRSDRVYALALAHAEADQTEAAAKGKTAVHLAGDWNAVLATTDRASG
jgi:hypothetical protein